MITAILCPLFFALGYSIAKPRDSDDDPLDYIRRWLHRDMLGIYQKSLEQGSRSPEWLFVIVKIEVERMIEHIDRIKKNKGTPVD